MTQERKGDSVSSYLAYISQEQMRQLISSVGIMRDRLILRILYETGCTLIELVDIKVADIGGNTIKLHAIEEGEVRFSKISGKLAKDISLYIEGNKLGKEFFLFSTRQSSGISEKRVRQVVQNYSERIGLGKINPVALRYSHIANAYLQGVFIESIASQLGLTTYRIFQVIKELGLKPKMNYYNQFLTRI